MSILRPCLAPLLLATTTTATLAFQPLITDDTGTQGQGGKQIEASYVDKQASLSGVSTQTRTLPMVFTWGATDTLDLYAGIVPTQIRSGVPGVDADGLGNTALGAKWRFLENADSGTSLAIKPEVRLPVGTGQEAAGLGTGVASYGLALILTQELPFGAVHVNLARGQDRFLDPDTRPHAASWRASVAPVWHVSEQWKLALDLGQESVSAAGNTVTTRFVLAGAVYSPDKDLDLAVGFLRNTDDAAPQTTTTAATVGLTWRFR